MVRSLSACRSLYSHLMGAAAIQFGNVGHMPGLPPRGSCQRGFAAMTEEGNGRVADRILLHGYLHRGTVHGRPFFCPVPLSVDRGLPASAPRGAALFRHSPCGGRRMPPSPTGKAGRGTDRSQFPEEFTTGNDHARELNASIPHRVYIHLFHIGHLDPRQIAKNVQTNTFKITLYFCIGIAQYRKPLFFEPSVPLRVTSESLRLIVL